MLLGILYRVLYVNNGSRLPSDRNINELVDVVLLALKLFVATTLG